MFTKLQLQNDLKRFNIPSTETVLIHSSCKSVGEIESGADTLLDLLSEYFEPGLLLFPTHTWDKVNKESPIYSVNDTVCCTGILPELFRKRDGVARSTHPTHSVAGLGNSVKEFIKGDEEATTPCPRFGSWGKLVDFDATIMLIGLTFTRNTFIHGIEEWKDIPNRISNEGYLATRILANGDKIEKIMHPHLGHPSENYDRILPQAIEANIVKKQTLGNSEVLYFKAQALYEFVNKILEVNPLIFD